MVQRCDLSATLRSFLSTPTGRYRTREAILRPALLFAVMALLIPYSEDQGQSVPASPAVQSGVPLNLPTSPRGYKPKISLQAALKIAESYVAAEHINVSDGWLSEARLFLYGDGAKADRDKELSWLFVWITDSSLGGHVDVIVSMHGKAMRLPTM
jgi:hypothetical protein